MNAGEDIRLSSEPPDARGLARAARQQSQLLQRLARRLEAVAVRVRLIETDISWILLAGDLAYKFKKAMRRDVLDYSSLAARHFACEEELRLNRRLAPALYLGVSAITGPRACPSIDGRGAVLEPAVRMRRFAQSALWQARLDAGQLGAAEASAFAVALADFHAAAPRAGREQPWGRAALVGARTREDLAGIALVLDNPHQRASLADVAAWLTAQEQRLARVFAQRKAGGWVRECHGDLHCGNILTLEGQVLAFDGIEFNPALRWIDVAQDMAFLWMDLQCQGRVGLAARLLNDYLERGGDYGCLAVLPYYRVQRALVRCKVALQRALPGKPGRVAAQAQAARYLAYAHACARPVTPALLIAHGLSGSGKSWLCDALVEPLAAVRLRSDVERKRLYGANAAERTRFAPGEGMYDRASNSGTYRQLARLAQQGLEAGFTMLVDAAFPERAWRLGFRRLARRCKAPFVLLHVSAPLPLLLARLSERTRAGTDPSDADPGLLAHQLAAGVQALPPDEALDAIEICNDAGFDCHAVAVLLRRLCQALQQRGAAIGVTWDPPAEPAPPA